MTRVPHFFAVALFVLGWPSLAQTHPRSQTRAKSIAQADPSAQRLADLLTEQQRALSTGEPASIAEATRPLASELLRNMAKLRLLQGKPAEAAELYQAALVLRDSTQTRLELTTALLRATQPRKAVAEAAKIVETDAQDASAWMLYGSALRASGREKEAAAAFSRSLELKPDPNVAYAFGAALLALHEREKAGRVFQQILTGSGNAAIWHVAIGDAYREALYLEDAVEEFKKAIAIDAHIGHAEFFLGLTYLQMNQWGPTSQSFEHLRNAVRLAPRDYLSNFYLGALESTDGSDLASSNRHLHAAAEANPLSPEAWLYLGLNAAREKKNDEAKLYLRKAVVLTGSDEARNNYQIRRVYAVLGRILISEGNRDEGNALLARYKRSEQQALGNSASMIAQSAQSDLASSSLSGVASAKTSFPGMRASAEQLSGDDAVKAADSAGPEVKHTAEETKRIAQTELQLSDLLASSFNDLGTAEARQGQYSVALRHFQEAERWKKPTPDLLHNLGTAAFRSGDFKESARALDLYLKLDQKGDASQDGRARVMLGMSQFSSGQFAEADKAFGAAAGLTMQDPRAAYSWAFSLAHSGQQQHANQIADQLRGVALPPDAMSLVCHIYMDTENYEQSIGCFRKVAEAAPGLPLAHYQIAESLIRLDRPAEAVPELRQELTLSPENPDVQYSLAFALLQSSHKEEAMTLLKNLTAAHPDHAQAQYQLGKALLEQGDVPQAVRHLELAEQNDPAPDYIHYQLQAAYRKAGKIGDADRELAVYREIKARNREVAPVHP